MMDSVCDHLPGLCGSNSDKGSVGRVASRLVEEVTPMNHRRLLYSSLCAAVSFEHLDAFIQVHGPAQP